jgi:hypothetical protein
MKVFCRLTPLKLTLNHDGYVIYLKTTYLVKAASLKKQNPWPVPGQDACNGSQYACPLYSARSANLASHSQLFYVFLPRIGRLSVNTEKSAKKPSTKATGDYTRKLPEDLPCQASFPDWVAEAAIATATSSSNRPKWLSH